MTTDETLIEQVKTILTERSKKAIDLSKQAVLSEHIKDESLREALQYFMEEICYDTSHPTLLSLACEAVGGNPEVTVSVGAALVVLAGAADMHDDVIDKSITKHDKPTVYGKYGKDTAIVAGDVLWIKGMQMLNAACEIFPSEKRQTILELTKQAFFDLGSAEVKEVLLHSQFDIEPEEYIEIIKLKVSLATASARIGAILGNGTALQVENLGEYAETLGVLMTIRDEFIDMFELDELTNRFMNECLPLPILCAFKNVILKEKILEFLRGSQRAEAKLDEILELVYQDSEVRKIGEYMHLLVQNTIKSLNYSKEPQGALLALLKFSLQDLPS
jgi:geranylgeranyl diphosphate synthase type I